MNFRKESSQGAAAQPHTEAEYREQAKTSDKEPNRISDQQYMSAFSQYKIYCVSMAPSVYTSRQIADQINQIKNTVFKDKNIPDVTEDAVSELRILITKNRNDKRAAYDKFKQDKNSDTLSTKMAALNKSAGERLGSLKATTKEKISEYASDAGKRFASLRESASDAVSNLTFSFRKKSAVNQSADAPTPLRVEAESLPVSNDPIPLVTEPARVLWADNDNHSSGVKLTKNDDTNIELKIDDFISFDKFPDGAVIRYFGDSGDPRREGPIDMWFTPWIHKEGVWARNPRQSRCHPGGEMNAFPPRQVDINWNTVEKKQKPTHAPVIPYDQFTERQTASKVNNLRPLGGLVSSAANSSSSSTSSTGSTGLPKYNVRLFDVIVTRRTQKGRNGRDLKSSNTRTRLATIQLNTSGTITFTFDDDSKPKVLPINDLKFDIDGDGSKGCMSIGGYNDNVRKEICITVKNTTGENFDFVNIPFTMRFEDEKKCDEFKTAVDTISSNDGFDNDEEDDPLGARSSRDIRVNSGGKRRRSIKRKHRSIRYNTLRSKK